jgi:CHAD domain-containing protein
VDGAQYLLPEGLDPASVTGALGAHLDVEADGGRSADRTFYDTFDGRLHDEGLVAVHDAGRLSVVDAAAYGERASAPVEGRPERLFATDLPPGSLRELLEPLIEMRALTPIARVRSRLDGLRVLDAERKTVVRLSVEEPTLVGAGPLRSRLHVRPVRGYDKALARVRGSLERELGFATAPAPLHDDAVIATGGTPGGTPSKLRLRLRPRQRADEAAAVVAAGLLAVIEANLPGTLADVDTEFLHDLRVSVRRTRSLQRQLSGVFPPEPLASFRAGFRWLQQATGEVRDLDVYLLDFDDFRAAVPAAHAADLDPLHELLARRRERERKKMVAALSSERAEALLGGWRAFIASLADSHITDRPDALRPVEEVAGERIDKVYRRMVKMGRAIDDDSPHEALHDLRKKGKELRYLLEFFSSLFPGDVVKPMVKSLKSLQDVLGRFQDRQVQSETIRALREDVVKLDDGAAALMAMGLLVDRLEHQQDEARAEFGERFAAFSSADQRRLVKDTFA